MASKDIVTIDGSITSKDVVAFIQNPSGFDIKSIVEDPEEVANRIAAQRLGATSAEQLFGTNEVIHGKDYTNRPFMLTGVEWHQSEKDNSFPIFGVFNIVDPQGEYHVMTCGARSVCMVAAKADAEGWLPRWVKLTASQTSSGNTALDLVGTPEPKPGEEAF